MQLGIAWIPTVLCQHKESQSSEATVNRERFLLIIRSSIEKKKEIEAAIAVLHYCISCETLQISPNQMVLILDLFFLFSPSCMEIRKDWKKCPPEFPWGTSTRLCNNCVPKQLLYPLSFVFFQENHIMSRQSIWLRNMLTVLTQIVKLCHAIHLGQV